MATIYQTLRKPLWALVGLALLVGLWGLYERLAFGHESMAYGSYVVWGLWVAMYLFFAGVAAGGFLVAVLDYLFEVKMFRGLGRLFLFASFLALVAGLLHIWFDVGHMGRVWRLFLTPSPSSVMVHMIWFYTAFAILVLVILAVDFWQGSRRLIKWLSALGIPLAIAFSGGVGALLGVQIARPFWHVGLYPVQFPVFSLASGVALVALIVAVFVDGSNPAQRERNGYLLNILGITTIVLTVVKLYFLWADFSQSVYAGLPANVEAVKAVVFGPHWWAFWILQIFIGSLVPILILLHPRWRVTPAWVAVAMTMVLVGFIAARVNIVLPALIVPEITLLGEAFQDPRLTFYYFPSLAEWALSIGITGFAILLFLLGLERLPLLEPVHMEVV
jgi:molybdopterin-containing oxidoreductase family membrane subunit